MFIVAMSMASLAACSATSAVLGDAIRPDTAGRATTVPTTSTVVPLPTPWDAEMLDEVNSHRAEHGVEPLVRCDTLQQAAQGSAEVLARWGKLSHTGPDGSEPRDRARDAGYRGSSYVGENIASGYGDAGHAMDGWMDSPGPRANILEPTFTHVGFGRASGDGPGSPYWVQKFGANATC